MNKLINLNGKDIKLSMYKVLVVCLLCMVSSMSANDVNIKITIDDKTEASKPTVSVNGSKPRSEAEAKAYEKLLYYIAYCYDRGVLTSDQVIPMLNMMIIIAPTDRLHYKSLLCRDVVVMYKKNGTEQDRRCLPWTAEEYLARHKFGNILHGRLKQYNNN